MLRARPPFPSGWASLPISTSQLTLANTLPVGQSFVWRRRTIGGMEHFSRAVDNPPRVVCLAQCEQNLYYTAIHKTPAGWEDDLRSGITKDWIQDYFQLHIDLERLYDQWAADPLFVPVPGVRVLRQDPWECLIAFITSANNNISRISSLLHKLGEAFSPELLRLEDEEGCVPYHLFPRPGDIPVTGLESVLRALGFGYRAGYIASTLGSINAKEGGSEVYLSTLRDLPIDALREELLSFKGVGRKVADCVMLMCCDKLGVIPIDTHIYKIARRHPALPTSLRAAKFSTKLYDPTQAFLAACWGELGGWCQAVVFAAEVSRATKEVKTKAGIKVEVKEAGFKAEVKEELEVKAEIKDAVVEVKKVDVSKVKAEIKDDEMRQVAVNVQQVTVEEIGTLGTVDTISKVEQVGAVHEEIKEVCQTETKKPNPRKRSSPPSSAARRSTRARR